jgi:hypothetical protein
VSAATRLALLLCITALGCKRSENKPGAAGQAVVVALRVPHVSVPIKLDGELNEPPWNAVAARTGPFVDATGGEARPYSEGRFLWDDENLYVGLYAADDNIRAVVTAHDGPVWTDDAFALHFTLEAPLGAAFTPGSPVGAPSSPTYAFDISAAGVVTDAKRVAGSRDDTSWESGIKVGVDRDGTLNDPKDEDEEWVVEAALPLRSLGLAPKAGSLARVLVDISRCDTPKRTKDKRCGAWGSPKEPKVLELGAGG